MGNNICLTKRKDKIGPFVYPDTPKKQPNYQQSRNYNPQMQAKHNRQPNKSTNPYFSSKFDLASEIKYPVCGMDEYNQQVDQNITKLQSEKPNQSLKFGNKNSQLSKSCPQDHSSLLKKQSQFSNTSINYNNQGVLPSLFEKQSEKSSTINIRNTQSKILNSKLNISVDPSQKDSNINNSKNLGTNQRVSSTFRISQLWKESSQAQDNDKITTQFQQKNKKPILPLRVSDKKISSQNCYICNQSFQGSKKIFLACHHTYHEDCIENTLMSGKKCPLCIKN